MGAFWHPHYPHGKIKNYHIFNITSCKLKDQKQDTKHTVKTQSFDCWELTANGNLNAMIKYGNKSYQTMGAFWHPHCPHG